MSFSKPLRTLLNSKFDGYKFAPLEPNEVSSHYPLEHKVSQTNVSGHAPLSFQEVESRVTHNHLSICSQARRAAYVDAEWRVVGIDVEEATLRPVFRMLFELPRPIQASAHKSLQREYPSVAFVNATSLFVADGMGSMYAIRFTESGPIDSVSTFELVIPDAYESSQRSVPFRLHQAINDDGQNVTLVLSSKHYPKTEQPVSKTSKSPQVKFDLWGVRVSLPLAPAPQTQPLPILWHRRGTDVPTYVAYDFTRKSILFVGTSAYLPAAAPPQSYEPSPEEIAPIPRPGENLEVLTNGTSKPPPYSWTQTSDSVTVAIPLPADTPTEHIRVAFSPRTLTFLVESPASAASTEVSITVPRYTLKQLWDGIHPGTSLWTFDRAAAGRYGILALHLDKQNEGTRWPHVFAAAGTGQGDEEVLETLDPTELYNIREALEKYTAALQSGTDASGLGLGMGVPGLAEGERDDELDLSVGKLACVTWVGVDGGNGVHGDGTPLQVLSTPFPGAAGASETSLVIKNGLDGITYTLKEAASPEDSATWEHTSTYSALAFVLASKRDTRFVHHVSSTAVFAFESGALDLGGNVYIYRGAGPKDNWAKQAILKIGGGLAGSLLGVGLMQVQGKKIILALCEGELAILNGVL